MTKFRCLIAYVVLGNMSVASCDIVNLINLVFLHEQKGQDEF